MSAPFRGGGDWGGEKLGNCQGGTANEDCALGLVVWAEVRVVSKDPHRVPFGKSECVCGAWLGGRTGRLVQWCGEGLGTWGRCPILQMRTLRP